MTWTPEYRAMYKQKVRDWYDEYKASIKCEHCGLPGDIWADKLQFHHPEPEHKTANVSSMVQWGWSIERIKREVDQCIPLCEDCHAKVHGFRNAEEMSPWKSASSNSGEELCRPARSAKEKRRTKQRIRGVRDSDANNADASMKSQPYELSSTRGPKPDRKQENP
jgi:hypothetical protein